MPRGKAPESETAFKEGKHWCTDMLVLALSVCLAGTPATCKEVNLTYLAEYATPMQCMRFGQPEIAKWHLTHPGWQVKKWRCVPADRLEKSI